MRAIQASGMLYLSNADLPAPVRRLPPPAQDIYREAFNDAHEEYGRDEDEIAHRVACSAVKRRFEKVAGVWQLRRPH
jgi:cation transport regulator